MAAFTAPTSPRPDGDVAVAHILLTLRMTFAVFTIASRGFDRADQSLGFDKAQSLHPVPPDFDETLRYHSLLVNRAATVRERTAATTVTIEVRYRAAMREWKIAAVGSLTVAAS